MSAVVETRSGKIEGRRLSTQFVFKGVPYAAPPVGPLRWQPPAPVTAWNDVRPATELGNASMQIPSQILLPSATSSEVSEDSLYLNVWTPELDGARRPVMLWIHGGGFMYGSGGDLMPEEQSLVTRGDVVLVSINYRLGPFGFLNLSHVTSGAIASSGNEGLLDMVAALEWVRANIERFGGDPDNVTIFGESAGGMAIGALLAMPSASHLFHKAILQSGAAHTANQPERVLNISQRVVELAGTTEADTLYSLSAERVLDLEADLFGGTPMQDESAWAPDPEIGSQPFQPCIDGKLLPKLPIHAVDGGSAAGKPLLVGTTLDEYKAFAYAEPSIADLDDDGIRARLGHVPEIDGLISAYRAGMKERGEPHASLDVFAAIGSDRQFRIPGLRLLEAQTAHEDRVFNYIVTWPSPAKGGAMGATHGIDLGLLFGSYDLTKASRAFFGTGPGAEKVSKAIQLAWTAFARTGDPSGGSVGNWPAYASERRSTMMLGDACEVEDAPLERERAAWDDVPDESIGEY